MLSNMNTMLFVLLLCLLAVCTVLLLVLLLWQVSQKRELSALSKEAEELRGLVEETGDDITDRISDRVADIQDDIGKRLSHDAEENRSNRQEVSAMIQKGSEQQQKSLEAFSDKQRESLEHFSERQQRQIAELREQQEKRIGDFSAQQQEQVALLREQQEKKLSEFAERQSEKLTEIQDRQFGKMKEQTEQLQMTLKTSLQELQAANREKLGEIQGEINKKLDTSLNERLDQSFKTVGEQLSQLYKSLGELGKLETGVESLNRTLSNVKTRGILGETQLENILASILTNTLYDKNVVTKKGSRDPVEFAVKIPDKEAAGSFMYLPIDSKFPTTIYDRICEAAEAGDSEALLRAQKELEQRIKTEAKSIFDKYVDPPQTTDFALMFLPTESLFAEVLRIPGLTEECQRKFHVVITGPTTIAALLNSLSIGFRYMAVNRDSQNILKLLSAIKTQYGTLSALIETAGNRLDSAKKATNDLRHRTELINKKLSSVEEIDAADAQQLLGLRSTAETADGAEAG